MSTNLRKFPLVRAKWEPLRLCKASVTKREYMAKTFSRTRFMLPPGQHGKACWLTDQVIAELALVEKAWRRVENATKPKGKRRPYIYLSEIVHELLREF